MKFFSKKSLYNLFINNKTGKPIHKWHHYFDIYEKHFSRIKKQNKKPVILEIGVQNGGSLLMWKKYFGKKSKIFGIDIDEECKKHTDLSKNIEVLIGDSSNIEWLTSIVNQLPEIDIVIDDGGHTRKQQINAFLALYDKISKNGVYLVEDLHCNYFKEFNDNPESFIDFAKSKIDLLHGYFTSNTNEETSFLEVYNRLIIPPKERSEKINVPLFTKSTHSISFYDSIIVFDKKEIKEPYTHFS